TNNPLNGERPLAWMWQQLHDSRLGGKASVFATLIFIRNLFQVAVSGDPRYGPIYNVGVARALTRSLLLHGYVPDSGIPIAVMGWSGGVQIAVGIAPYLHQALGAPIIIVSIGGVMSDDPGIDKVEHIYHLQGSRDHFPDITEVLYPGRWPFMRHSHWNRAREAGKITIIDPGPMRHTGKDDYLDRRAELPGGQSHLDRTVEVVTAALSGEPIPPLGEEISLAA
ncbi:MAG: CAAX protease, partial [Candidatus Promineifilaceae bacterium]